MREITGDGLPYVGPNGCGRYVAAPLLAPLVVSLPNHEPPLILRQAQDERPEGVSPSISHLD